MSSNETQRYKLIIYTPTTHAEAIKEAVFNTGAGTIGVYKRVCFTTAGTGEFVPSADAKPYLGVPERKEVVEEVRVEVQVRGREVLRDAVGAVRRTHPYEEPVYEVYKIEDF